MHKPLGNAPQVCKNNCMKKPGDASEKLSRRERQIMDAVHRQGEATVGEVVGAIADAPSYNSIRNLMAQMERKGLLSHREEGVRYLYRPTERRATAAKSALLRVVETFFGGSVEQTVTALLSSEEIQLSPEGAARIEALITAARQENAATQPQRETKGKHDGNDSDTADGGDISDGNGA